MGIDYHMRLSKRDEVTVELNGTFSDEDWSLLKGFKKEADRLLNLKMIRNGLKISTKIEFDL